MTRRIERLEGRINRRSAQSPPDDGVVLKKDITQAETLVEAWSQFDAGNAKAAESLCKKALNENSADPDAPELLGLIAMTKKDWVGAEGHIHRSLNARMDARRAENPDVAVSMAHLGRIRWMSGDLDGSQEFFAHSIDIFDSSVGPNDTEALLALDPMAKMYIVLWKHTGTDSTPANLSLHQMVAEKVLWLAGRFRQRKDFTHAETLLKILLAEERTAVLQQQWIGIETQTEFAYLYIDMDTPDLAYQHMATLYPISNAWPMKSKVRVAQVIKIYLSRWHSKSTLADSTSQWRISVNALNWILDVYQQAGGLTPADLVMAADNIVDPHKLKTPEQYDDAAALYHRLLAANQSSFRANHPCIAYNLWRLARIYAIYGKYDDAERAFGDSVKMYETMLGPNHPELYSELANWGDLKIETKHFAEAEILYRRALAICEETQGPTYSHVSTITHNIGRICEYQKKFDEAKKMYNRAAAIIDMRAAKQADDADSKWK